MLTTAKKIGLLIISLIVTSNILANTQTKINTWYTHKDSGTQVFFVESHALPIVDIKVIFYAGYIYDGKNYGLANLTNKMLAAGTKNLTANQIATNFDNLGAIFYPDTDNDTASLNLRCLTDPKIISAALKNFTTILSEPTFPLKEIVRIKKQLETRIHDTREQPYGVSIEEFKKLIYGSFPYNHQTIGTLETLPHITRAQLQNFYHKYYTTNNALILIVGDISATQAQEIAKQLTGKLPRGSKAPTLTITPPKTKALTKHIEFPSTQTVVALGQISTKRNNPDYFPLMVGNYILGGSLFTSELHLTIREKLGLVYNIHSQFSDPLYPGPFVINFSTSNETAQKAMQNTQEVLKDFVKNGPTTKQSAMHKKSLIGQFPLSIASNSQIMNMLAEIAIFSLPLDYLDTYVEKVKAVTLEQIRDAFQKHLDPDNFLIVTVGKSVISRSEDKIKYEKVTRK